MVRLTSYKKINQFLPKPYRTRTVYKPIRSMLSTRAPKCAPLEFQVYCLMECDHDVFCIVIFPTKFARRVWCFNFPAPTEQLCHKCLVLQAFAPFNLCFVAVLWKRYGRFQLSMQPWEDPVLVTVKPNMLPKQYKPVETISAFQMNVLAWKKEILIFGDNGHVSYIW